MIRLRCGYCGQPNDVESMITAGRQPCAECGHTIIGGQAPPPDRATSPVGHWDYDSGSKPVRSVGTTVLGILIILASIPGFMLVTCFGMGLSLSFVAASYKEPPRESPPGTLKDFSTRDEEPDPALRRFEQTLLTIALVFFGTISCSLLLAGIGVLRRRQWARYLTLACGTLVCLSAFLVAYKGGSILFAAILFAVFAVFAGVLLTEKASAELRHRDAWRFP